MSRRHVAGVFDALYQGLAAQSRRVSDDGVAVRLFVASRVMGDLALAARGAGDVAPDPLVAEALEHAGLEDSTGVFTLYVFTMVLAPRLLVSVRDARDGDVDPEFDALLARAATEIVGQIGAVSDLLRRRTPDEIEWAEAARAIVDTLESAGYSDHLGPR